MTTMMITRWRRRWWLRDDDDDDDDEPGYLFHLSKAITRKQKDKTLELLLRVIECAEFCLADHIRNNKSFLKID